jgi:hypothetical protein
MLMMKQTVLGLAVAALFGSAPFTPAAPFDPKDVIANPASVLHVDCDALRGCSVAQFILAQPDVQKKLAMVTALFDFDPSKQLHGVTVYTSEDHPKDGALIVYADFDPKRLLTFAEAADGYEQVTNKSHVFSSWLDDKKKAKDGVRPRIYGAIVGHRVVFAQNESHMAEVLDVIDGKAPAYSGKNAFLPAADGESVVAQAVIRKFDFDDDGGGPSQVFKLSKSARAKLSETAGTVTATVQLQAADEDTAKQIEAIGQGLIAMLKLQKADQNALKLANAVDLKQDGPSVKLSLSLPSTDLIDVIKKGQEKKEEAKAKDADAPKS